MRMLSGIAHQGSACVCVCVNPGRQEIIVFTVPSKCLYILLVSHRFTGWFKKKTYHNIFFTSSTKLNLLSFNVLS